MAGSLSGHDIGGLLAGQAGPDGKRHIPFSNSQEGLDMPLRTKELLNGRIMRRIYHDRKAGLPSDELLEVPRKPLKGVKLTLHIGDPKTGTSSIQRVLQLGLVDSPAGSISGFRDTNNTGNAVPLARSFLCNGDGSTRSWLKQKVRPRIMGVKQWLKDSDSDYPVISSEFFSGADPKAVHHAFSKHFPVLSKHMKVIAYVRPHHGRLLSAYTERIKCGYTTSNFETWLPAYLNSGILSYTLRFKKWREVFQEKFILRPFIRDQMLNGDVVDDFFSEVLSGQCFSVHATTNENQSVSLRSLAGLRRFNQKLTPIISNQGRIAMSRTIKDGIPTPVSEPKPALDRHSATLIGSLYKDDARALDVEFFQSPLFTEALGQAINRASGPLIDLSLKNHFSARDRGLLDDRIERIIERLPLDFESWHSHYKEARRLYHSGADRPTEWGGDLQKRLQDLCEILAESGGQYD